MTWNRLYGGGISSGLRKGACKILAPFPVCGHSLTARETAKRLEWCKKFIPCLYPRNIKALNINVLRALFCAHEGHRTGFL